MKAKEKVRIEELRKTNAIKTMYYTRYFMVRYVVAFFFFINLYWALMLYLSKAYGVMVLPVSLCLLGILSMWEQFTMFTTNQKNPKFSKVFFEGILLINTFLTMGTLVGITSDFFPFFKTTWNARLTIIGMLICGIFLAGFMLYRMAIIDTKQDRQIGRIDRYLAALKS